MAGAGLLSARSALRSGAGYVRLVTHPDNREIVQAALPEAVYVDATDDGAVAEAIAAAAAIAAGPGLGTDAGARRLLDRVLEAGGPRVLDADALTLLSPVGPEGELGPTTVLTPHPGEAARLLASDVDAVQGDRVGTVAALAGATGAVALLKGSPTLIQAPEGLLVDGVGSSDLAVAGMGDTLTGAIGAFLAQGCDPWIAAGLGIVATGRAAARADRGAGLQATDVPEHLPDALQEGAGTSRLPLAGLLLGLVPPR